MQVDYPYRIDSQGVTAAVDSVAHVRDLVEQVLFTLPGERVMRPTFGSGLAQLVFQPASDELATAVQFMVQGNLQQWLGDVVTVEDVTVTTEDSAISIVVRYVVRRTQERRVDQFVRSV